MPEKGLEGAWTDPRRHRMPARRGRAAARGGSQGPRSPPCIAGTYEEGAARDREDPAQPSRQVPEQGLQTVMRGILQMRPVLPVPTSAAGVPPAMTSPMLAGSFHTFARGVSEAGVDELEVGPGRGRARRCRGVYPGSDRPGCAALPGGPGSGRGKVRGGVIRVRRGSIGNTTMGPHLPGKVPKR